MIRITTLALVLAGAALAGCNKAPPPAAQGAADFNTTLTTAEVMTRVIDPVTQRMLGRAGTVDTAEGSKSMLPKTDDEWNLAENEAAILVESGNLLLIPSRIQKVDANDTDWTKYAKLMTEISLQYKDAIKAKDGQKMFDLGAKLWDETCTTCHVKYAIPKQPKS